MFKSLKSSAGVLAITAIVVEVAVAGLAAPARAASGGNSANAKLCQHGGYQSWVRADQTPFANVDDCVSYAAHGGTLTTPTISAQALCESYGGTFGNTNLTFGSWPTILWTCNGWPYVSDADWQAKYASLGTACLSVGATGYAGRGLDATLTGYFTCGHA